jgi:hypothetical protein
MLLNNKHEANKMNTDEIIEYVQENAKYLDYDDEPYAINYKSESFWGESPRDLVNQIIRYEESNL